MMFLSDRDLFSIDLFLAEREPENPASGTKTAVDAHLQSIEFSSLPGAGLRRTSFVFRA